MSTKPPALPPGVALAIDTGLALTPTESWWQVLRLGPVYEAGELIVDITDDVCTESVKAWRALCERVPVPIDMDHGLYKASPAGKVTYGRVIDMEHRPGQGLWVQVALTAGGKAFVGETAGAMWTSPVVMSDAHDPDTGEPVAGWFIDSVSLTARPRQSRMEAVGLARGLEASMILCGRFAGPEGSAARHRSDLEKAARRACLQLGWRDYIYLVDWGTDPGFVVVETYNNDEHQLVRWDVDDSGDIPVLSNPVLVEAGVVYRPIQRQQAAVGLSKEEGGAHVDGAQKTPPSGDEAVKLARQLEEHRTELAKEREASAALAKRVEAAEADAKAKGLALDAVQAQIKTLQAEADARAALAREEREKRFMADLARRHVDQSEDGRKSWVELHRAAPDQAEAALARIPMRQAPVGAPSGLSGTTDVDTKAAQLARDGKIRARAVELQGKNKGMEFEAAWHQAAAELEGKAS